MLDKQKKPEQQYEKSSFIPFIGPRPFSQDLKDQKIFFGRNYESEKIISLIFSHKLVLVYAQSGAGKTSIFNAKIVHELEEKELQVLPIARVGIGSNVLNKDSDNSTNITDEKHSLKYNLYILNTLQSLVSNINSLFLKDKSLSEFLKTHFPHKINQRGKPIPQVIIFDQLEEIFNLYSDPNRWNEDQKDFFLQISDALEIDPLLRIVFVIREDYLAQLDPFAYILPEKLKPRFRLERLRKDAAYEAVKGPLEKAKDLNLINYSIINKLFEEKIIERLIEDLLKIHIETFGNRSKEIKGEFVEPIQLQVACQRLWNNIRVLQIDQINQNSFIYLGHVDQALIDFYEDAIGEASKKSKIFEGRIREWFNEKLITSSDTRSNVHREHQTTGGIPNIVVDILENKYIIRKEERFGAKWYELAHDRLIKPIQESNKKWKKQYEKRKKVKILTIIIPSIISVGIIILMLMLWNIDEYDIPPVETIFVGELPFLTSIDQTSGLVYVTNPKIDTISVINGKKNDLIKVINVRNEPTDIAVDPKHNVIYATHPTNKSISVIQRDYILDILNPLINKIPVIPGLFDYKNIGSVSLNYLPFSLGINYDHSKLYVTHSLSDRLSVIDTNTYQVLKIIKVGNQPNDVFVDSRFNKLYVTNQGDNTVSVINGTNYDLLKTITVGKNPNSIAFNPNENKVYVANKGDNTVTVIDGRNDYHIGISNFEVGTNPTSVNINEERNILYVINNLDHTLTARDMVINFNNTLDINKIPVGLHPSGIALYENTDDQSLLVANTDSDTVSVIDVTHREIKEQFKVGHKPRDIDTLNDTIYVSNSMSNTVTVIDQVNGYIKNIPTEGKYPIGLGVNKMTNLVYVANTDSDTVSLINGTTNQVESTIDVGNGPTGIAVDSKNNLVYVTNYDNNSISMINGTTNQVESTIDVGNGPTGIAVDSKNNLVYVTNYNDDTISVISATNQRNYGEVPISKDYPGNGPTAIAVDSKNNKIYILNIFSDNISIIDIDLITDSIQNNKTIVKSWKYVTIAIPAGEIPMDILLYKEKIYVTNRNHNIINILNISFE